MKFSGKVGSWPVNKRLNFDIDPDHECGYRSGKTCFGGGMHCPGASSLILGLFFISLERVKIPLQIWHNRLQRVLAPA